MASESCLYDRHIKQKLSPAADRVKLGDVGQDFLQDDGTEVGEAALQVWPAHRAISAGRTHVRMPKKQNDDRGTNSAGERTREAGGGRQAGWRAVRVKVQQQL